MSQTSIRDYMRIYSAYWDRDYSPENNDQLLMPVIGQIRDVYLEPSFLDSPLLKNSSRSFQLCLFYLPIYSQLYGWEITMPQEVMGSYIIRCEINVLEPQPAHNSRIKQRIESGHIRKSFWKFSAKVLEITPFLALCKRQTQQLSYNTLPTDTWKACNSYEKIRLEDHIYYLEGNGIQETHLALIIKERGNDLSLLFHNLSYSWEDEEAHIINYTLQDEELSIFKSILNQAKEIKAIVL